MAVSAPNRPLTPEILAKGPVIRKPVGRGQGYWVGCPGAFYDPIEHAWYLTYRVRRPRGVAPDRGGEARIARSVDLQRWDDVLTIRKDQYRSASIERSCIHRGKDGHWRYFTSYVDPADGRWCTAMIKAPEIGQLDPAKRQVPFTGPPLGLEGVKDPWILEENGVYHLFLSVAIPTPKTTGGSHATLDIFSTGECKSATGLATSHDLDHWDWQGVVFAPQSGRASYTSPTGYTSPTSSAAREESGTLPQPRDRPSEGWDCYCRRINSVVPLSGIQKVPTPDAQRPTLNAQQDGSLVTPAAARYLAFYDGSGSHLENYEEKTGLAVSDDLRHWQTVTPDGPKFVSPHASGSLRYIDAKLAGSTWRLFYEFGGPDGAHDMRMTTCEEAALLALVR